MNQKTEKKITDLFKNYPQKSYALLPALHILQEDSNTLTEHDIKDVAQLLGVSVSQALGVATYYTMFNTTPVGKYHIQVDTNIPAFLAGADSIFKHLKKQLGIASGKTTKDGRFTLSAVEDLGACGGCPVIQVNDRYYQNMTIAKVDALVDSLKKGKLPPAENKINYKTECKILLPEKDQQNRGYSALKKALGTKPQQLIQVVKDAEIKGRGGAGFPTGVKWGFLPQNDVRPVYLICNADEGEPGTFKDRMIMEHNPHLLIEGIAISAYAIQAKLAYIYIRGEYKWIADILNNAIEDATAKGLLKHVKIVVHRGAGSYVCGEETALIESLEGKRGNPRNKPPFPANVGFDNNPTIVNNVETLASIPFIIEKGAAAFKKIGSKTDYGPKLFGVSGHVKKPGVFEFPIGTSLTKIIEAAGGVKGKLKAVIVGGLSVPILTAEESKKLNMDYTSCLKAGTMLGSGGIIVINDTVSIPELALRSIQFYAHESCGQCTPCSKGSHFVMKLLSKIVNGTGTKSDLEAVISTCKQVQGLTLCPTGDAFGLAILTLIEKFKNEFKKLIK